MAFEPATEYQSYDQVPTMRKRWVFILSILFFIPLGLFLAFSGEIYASQGGKVVKMDKKTRIIIAVCWTVILVTRISTALIAK
ncbi:hypothetical protein L6R29_11970 [Myxococcota bacterium]|nr:hypothetical protein [Myxococcota bacterium]